MWLARLHDQNLPKNTRQALRAILGCATLRLKIQEGHNQSEAMLHQPKETASRGEDANRHTACSERGKRASLARRASHESLPGEASHSSKAEEKQATMSLPTSWWNHSLSDQSALQGLPSRLSWTCTTEKHRPSITSTIDRAANGSF